MTRTALMIALRAVLGPTMPGVAMVQGWQPTTQGTPGGATLTFYVVSDVDYGSPARRDVWNPDTGLFDHLQVQVRETTFQVNALIPSVAIGAEQPDEMLARFRGHLRSDPVLAGLRARGVSMLRPRDVRQPAGEGDRGQPEQTPSFDLTLRHSDILLLSTPPVTSTEVHIERV